MANWSFTNCSRCGVRRRKTYNGTNRCHACTMAEKRATRDQRFVAWFWDHVDAEGDCWLWTGRVDHWGYGRISHPDPTVKRRATAHRFAYESLVGPVPNDLHLDHLCRNTRCVNPDHLEPVTPGENARRGFGISTLNRRKRHCPQGHPYDSANTYVVRTTCARQCRTCNRTRNREWMRVQRTAA